MQVHLIGLSVRIDIVVIGEELFGVLPDGMAFVIAKLGEELVVRPRPGEVHPRNQG